MIRQIDFNVVSEIQELYRLQKISYMIEAELICFFDIPALKETFEELQKCQEFFYGYYDGGKLLGAVSFEFEGKKMNICRMVVHPDHFRKGIAKSLLIYLEKNFPQIDTFIVSTGRDNLPAKTLYLNNGFQFVRDLEVAPDFFITFFEKKKKH